MFSKISLILVSISSISCANIEITTETTTETTTKTDLKVKSTDIQLCTNLTPNLISSRNGLTQTLKCSATICGSNNEYSLSESPVQLNEPVFDWNSPFGHIILANGTCDYAKLKCWHSINIDVRYFTDEMLDNGLKEIQLSCYVSDSFVSGDSIQFASGSDYSLLRLYKGRRLNENCERDSDCGDNMFCETTSKTSETVCQCSVDFLTGIQNVEVIDNYLEMVCVTPVIMNGSCLYDKQCQAFDANSVCAKQFNSNDNYGKCDCNVDSVYYEDRCQSPIDATTKPPIVWWIFTTDYNDNNNGNDHFRFMSLRNTAYAMAMLAIFLPLLLIFISFIILCYRKVDRERQRQRFVKTMFPTPRLRINDLCDIKKEKSDDKYDLVKNDQLEKGMA